MKNFDNDELLFENNYVSKSNKYLEINTFNKNLKFNNIKDVKEKKNKKNYINNGSPEFKFDQAMRVKQINNKGILAYEEIMNFNKVNIFCIKDNLLPEEVISHCNKLLHHSDIEYIKSNLPTTSSNSKWIRKDLSKEIKEAEEYIKNLKIEMKKDNFKFENIFIFLWI